MKKMFVLVIVLSMFIGNITYAQGDEPSEWANEIIIELQSKELLRNETFTQYQENITRGEFIYLAVRIYEIIQGEEIKVDESINFTDTDDIYALKGATVKITSGIGNNQFGYNQLLTREQLATLMINVITLLEVEMNEAEKNMFADDEEISSWARDAIYKARANNIISGVGNNKVNPKGNASVQVALVITSNILNEYYTPSLSSDVERNIYTQSYLENLVNTTDAESMITKFRNTDNSRRNGLDKVEGKYFDIYYPTDAKSEKVVKMLEPHMDKVYMMLTDLYGTQAKVEVHLIHEDDTDGLMEGKIRAEEFVTYVWIEEYNDGIDGINNLAEFVHEINHNFFASINDGATNEMWINEANAKFIASMYSIHLDYHNDIQQYSFYSPEITSTHNTEMLIDLTTTDDILEEEKSWGYSDVLVEKQAIISGMFFWEYIYNNSDFDTFKYYLRNLGNGDVITKIEELTGNDIEYFDKVLKETSAQ